MVFGGDERGVIVEGAHASLLAASWSLATSL